MLEPSKWVDEEVTKSLAKAVIGQLADGVFDDLPKEVRFQESYQSRIGYGADINLAEWVVSELQAKVSCSQVNKDRPPQIASFCSNGPELCRLARC